MVVQKTAPLCLLQFFYTRLSIKCPEDPKRKLSYTPGTYKNKEPNEITVMAKIHLKSGSIIRSFVKLVLEPILFIFAIDEPP